MKQVVMLCTAASGGMSQVVQSLRQAGLFEKHGIKLIVTHDRGSLVRRLALAGGAFFKFVWLACTRQVSLVHAHVAMRGSFWRKSAFLTVAQVCGIPRIVHLHGSEFRDFYERGCGRMQRAIIRYQLTMADSVVVLSATWSSYIQGIAPGARTVTIHNFVNERDLRSSVAASGVTRSSRTVLFLGEIGHRKGIFDLLRAFRRVVDRYPDACLVAGGTGELAAAAELVDALGIEKCVTFPGWVAGSEKCKLLARATLYALPSYNEGLPVSILEAMAVGLPIVSTPVGGIPDAVTEGVNGFMVEPGDIESLADRICRLLGDERLRQAMGSNATGVLEARFSSASASAEISALYGALERQ